MKNILSGEAHEVVFEARTGTEAVDAYRRLRPDLVMMDVTMPEVDGIEAARRIMAEFPGARIIMVTSITSEAIVRRTADLGVSAYLVKPFTTERAVELVNKVLAV